MTHLKPRLQFPSESKSHGLSQLLSRFHHRHKALSQEWWVCVWGFGCVQQSEQWPSRPEEQEGAKFWERATRRRIKTRKGRTATASQSLFLWRGTLRLAHSRCSIKRRMTESTKQLIRWNCTCILQSLTNCYSGGSPLAQDDNNRKPWKLEWLRQSRPYKFKK